MRTIDRLLHSVHLFRAVFLLGALVSLSLALAGLQTDARASNDVWLTLPDASGQPAPQAQSLDYSVFIPLVARLQGPGTQQLYVTHAGSTFVYTDGSSCASCHAAEGAQAHQSNHYQWQGKLGSINDFCGYPDINFIGKLTNLDGKLVDGGCAVCHAGMGKKPSQGGVENVDCLMCHSPEYQRTVMNVDGAFRFVPIPGTVEVRSPGRQECLRCHIGAGGGPNNKRGDLEPAHIEPPSASFDVHMASPQLGGAGLVCIDCHVTQDHKIAGRGADLRIDEGAPMKRCADCHSTAPHDSGSLNEHTTRVACESCHIPAFARIQSTDMYRDFREAEVDPLKRLYEPKLTRQDNVIPVYAFWDGGTQFYPYGGPADAGTLLASPTGDINTPAARLQPFKLHHAMQAHDPLTGQLIPIKAGILFQTGDVDRAILQGAADAGLALPQGYDFIETARYMGIFHEVAPSSDALACADCHDPASTRIDFAGLGYTPRVTRESQPLCTSCHEDEDPEWAPNVFFYRLHDKHVDDKRIECVECHIFER